MFGAGAAVPRAAVPIAGSPRSVVSSASAQGRHISRVNSAAPRTGIGRGGSRNLVGGSALQLGSRSARRGRVAAEGRMLAVQVASSGHHKKRSAVSSKADVEARAVTSDDEGEKQKRPRPDVALEGRALLWNVLPACAVAALGAFQFGYHLAVSMCIKQISPPGESRPGKKSRHLFFRTISSVSKLSLFFGVAERVSTAPHSRKCNETCNEMAFRERERIYKKNPPSS
eukprot:1182854-Prorocentrum_minimum.AAC.2